MRLLPGILTAHKDRFALMKDGKILGYYSSSMDARSAADAFIPDKLYSIQKVTNSAIDLGYFSHAVHLGPVQPKTGASSTGRGGAS